MKKIEQKSNNYYDIEESSLQIDIGISSFLTFPKQLEVNVPKQDMVNFVKSFRKEKISNTKSRIAFSIQEKKLLICVVKRLNDESYMEKISGKKKVKMKELQEKIKEINKKIQNMDRKELIKMLNNLVGIFQELNAYFYWTDLFAEIYAKQLNLIIYEVIKKGGNIENMDLLVTNMTNILLVSDKTIYKKFIVSPRHLNYIKNEKCQIHEYNSENIILKKKVIKWFCSKLDESDEFLNLIKKLSLIPLWKEENYQLQLIFLTSFKNILNKLQKYYSRQLLNIPTIDELRKVLNNPIR